MRYEPPKLLLCHVIANEELDFATSASPPLRCSVLNVNQF